MGKMSKFTEESSDYELHTYYLLNWILGYDIYVWYLYLFTDADGITSEVGSEPIMRSETDKSKNAVFIPNILAENSIQDEGNLTEWQVYFFKPGFEVYLQVWRLLEESLGGETLTLIGQTRSFTTDGFKRITLSSDVIPVKPGDHIAFYFPVENKIPWDVDSCQWGKQRLRYLLDPYQEELITDSRHTFYVAPLTMNPCREYSLKAIISKSQKIRDIDPMLGQCWASVVDDGPTVI